MEIVKCDGCGGPLSSLDQTRCEYCGAVFKQDLYLATDEFDVTFDSRNEAEHQRYGLVAMFRDFRAASVMLKGNQKREVLNTC